MSFEILGYIMWDKEKNQPFERLGPRQWTGKRKKKPAVIYSTRTRAEAHAKAWGCEVIAVWVPED